MDDEVNPYATPAATSVGMSASTRRSRPGRRVLVFGGAAIVGIVVAVAGLIHGVLFVGMPYPDAPPALLERQQFHLSVSNVMIQAGMLILGLSFIATVAASVIRLVAFRAR